MPVPTCIGAGGTPSSGRAVVLARRNTFAGAPANDPKALYPNQGFGFRFNGDCRNLLLLENTITGNGGGGIQACGANLSGLRFAGNTITGNLGPALSGDPGEKTFWKDNTVRGNGVDNRPEAVDESDMFELEVTAPRELAEGVIAAFSCRIKDDAAPPAHVLWDFGRGLPATGAETAVQFEQLPMETLEVTVLAWDDAGNVVVADAAVKCAATPTQSR